MRSTGTAEELERRRRPAVELMRQDETPSVIARILGVRRTSLYRWRAAAEAAPDELASWPTPDHATPLRPAVEAIRNAAPRGGQGPRLADRTVDRSPGRRADRVPFPRPFHPEHVRTVLNLRLNWSSQKPLKRAKERDEVAIDH
jgi:hypothetical protein